MHQARLAATRPKDRSSNWLTVCFYINWSDIDIPADDDGFTEAERAPGKVKLTLMEEVLLLGLKDKEVRP